MGEKPDFRLQTVPYTPGPSEIDVKEFKPVKKAMIDIWVSGYPVEWIVEIPGEEYGVQDLINRCKTYHRSDGHIVKLSPVISEGDTGMNIMICTTFFSVIG